MIVRALVALKLRLVVLDWRIWPVHPRQASIEGIGPPKPDSSRLLQPLASLGSLDALCVVYILAFTLALAGAWSAAMGKAAPTC